MTAAGIEELERLIKRHEDTIAALKIALEQAAALVAESASWVHEGVSAHGSCQQGDAEYERLLAEVTRFRAMTSPDWEALPVDVTGAGGDA